MLLIGTIVLWSTLVACQNRQPLSLQEENIPLHIDGLIQKYFGSNFRRNPEVIQPRDANHIVGSHYDAKAIDQNEIPYDVAKGVIC